MTTQSEGLLGSSDTRHLICENVACNPGLADYDAAAARYQSSQCSQRTLRVHIAFMLATLTHTPHVPTSQIYDKLKGRMVDRWKCTVCGYSRKY